MDEKLVKKAIRGNFNAYSILVHGLKEEGYKLAYTILKNEHDSMDAYLQAVEKGSKNITNLKESQYFKTWFLKIVINEAKNIIAKNSKVIFLDEIEERREINHEDKESKLEEIATILDVPIGTVKGKMYSALRDMKKELEVR